MTEQEIKQFIVEKTMEGLTLSQIQDELNAQGEKIRFMELRMLAAESEDFLAEKRAEKAAAEAAAAKKAAEKKAAAAPAPARPPFAAAKNSGGSTESQEDFPEDEPADLSSDAPAKEDASAGTGDTLRGQTTVTLSPIQRPGMLASGTVNFGSGATAEWFLDQTGRLGLSNATGQPDQKDVQEFQVELRKLLGA